MAPVKIRKSKYHAKLVTGIKKPCAFCLSAVDDEINYGKIYAIGDIHCHYYCVLLSSCLVQRGKDEEGLFGFLYEDIVVEVERCKKHKCSYCQRFGANLGCSISQCRKQFHLACGKGRDSVSIFYGNYKSFCKNHAPRQKVPDSIMIKARARMKMDKQNSKQQNFRDLKELSIGEVEGDDCTDSQSVCVICYEQVLGFPTVNTFWPPCCARDAWLHRSCVQRMALSAGMHFLKCPLCNDKDNFYKAVMMQGYYVPDRDAAWELEQNAFAEIYERPVSCAASDCACPHGREHDADFGPWCIKLCLLCGSSGQHNSCLSDSSAPHICTVCTPAAPTDLEQLASTIEAVISQEQAQASAARSGPVMPSRMSIRRTKGIATSRGASSSSALVPPIKTETSLPSSASSREDLDLKPPRKPLADPKPLRTLGYPFESPSKLLEKYNSPRKILIEGVRSFGGTDTQINDELVADLRNKFRKPKPLSKKRKIVSDILNGLFDDLLQDLRRNDLVRQWCSPKRCDDIAEIVPIMEICTPEPIEPPSTPIKSELSASETPPKENIPKFKDLTSENELFEFPILAAMLSCGTPQKLRTIEIEKDSSIEISENDQIVNIDVVKCTNNENEDSSNKIDPNSPHRNTFQFSPSNKDVLTDEKVDIDLESFKNQYLSEVVRESKKSSQKYDESKQKSSKRKSRKRKRESPAFVLKYESKKRKKERKKKISIKNKNIQLKIQWKKEELELKITDAKKKKKKNFQQYILQYSPKCAQSISKPQNVITPIKKKKIKLEKSPDNLIQTNIEKFFKLKSEQPSNS